MNKLLSMSRLFLALAFILASLTPAIATAQTGDLRVVISPQEARDSGARWRTAGLPFWLESGDTLANIEVGSVIVEFLDIPGWIAPEAREVFIMPGTMNNLEVSYTPAANTGQLIVTLEPQEARTAGAQWALRTEGFTDWRNSGDILINIPAGEHVITFRQIDDWIQPVDQVVTIAGGETLSRSYVYSHIGPDPDPEFGRLIVTLEPQAARLGGAQWALRTEGFTAWRNSGDILIDIPAGDHVITFKQIDGWTQPVEDVVAIVGGRTMSLSYEYSRIGPDPEEGEGFVQVFIDPQEARDAGAGWRFVGDDTWRDSGARVALGVDIVREIEFRPIFGWVTPFRIPDVSVEDGATTTYHAYYAHSAQLIVTIEPYSVVYDTELPPYTPLPVERRAQWRIAGGGGWLDSGVTLSNLESGTYLVEFKPVSGWLPPQAMQVDLVAGLTTSAVGTYVLDTTDGALQVLIEWETARRMGGQWRRVGTERWRNHGSVEYGFPEGTYTVEFKPLPGFDTPPNKAVWIHRGQMSTITGIYGSDDVGAMQVFLEPAAARNLGAQWRRVGTETWMSSGAVDYGLDEGWYAVEFREIYGDWIKPENKNVLIERNRFSTVIGSYNDWTRASLQVFLAPDQVRASGARWRRLGTDEWLTSGAMEQDIPAGPHHLEFLHLAGWSAPPLTAVDLAGGRTNTLSFNYQQWSTEIGLINTSHETIDGTLRVRNIEGHDQAVCHLTLQPYGRLQLVTGTHECLPALRGYALFETAVDDVVGYTRFSIPDWFGAAVPMTMPSPADELHVTHITTNDEWQTSTVLVNTTSQQKNITTTFNDGREFQAVLAPHEHRLAAFNGPVEGSATISNAAGLVGLEIFGQIARPTLAGISLSHETATTLVYPHVAHNEQWWTGMVVYNPGETEAQLTIRAYNAAGVLLETLTPDPLPSRAKLVGVPEALQLPAATDWFVVESTVPVTGFELFGATDGSNLAGYSVVNITATTAVFPKVTQNGWTGIALVNSNAEPATVVLEAIDYRGQQVATATFNMTPWSKQVGMSGAFFGQDVSQASYIRYTSDKGIAGFQLNGSSNGMTLDALPALHVRPGQEAGMRTFYFPHIHGGP